MAKVTATVCGKGLGKMEKALSLQVEDMNRKRVLMDGNVMPESTESIERLQQGPPEMSDHIHITFKVYTM